MNLIVRDMCVTLAFYRRLGLEIADGPAWPPGTSARHASVRMANGTLLEFDNSEMAHIWHRGFVDLPPSRGGLVLGFGVATREAVDAVYTSLTAAGAPGRHDPPDAFWGARYAIVQDPDGNDVGILSPIDPLQGYIPQP